jgi:hypothetical protein
MPPYGTLALADLLARSTQSILEYGEANLLRDIQVALDAHNVDVQDQLTSIGVALTTDRIRSYGVASGARGRMHRVDEFGSVDVQKVKPSLVSDNLGFPLYRNQYAMGWTRDYFETRSPRDAALQLQGAMEADIDIIEYELKNAFFNPANDLTYYDSLVDDLQIPIRRLHNADSTLILPYRNKTFVGATHTHYLARAGGSLTDADVTAAVDTVIEHGVAGPVEIWINLANEPTLSALASFYEFDAIELITPQLIAGTQIPRSGQTQIVTVNPNQPDNRAIGRWRAVYTIRTKPWVPSGYIMVVDTGRNPLAWRTRAVGTPLQGNMALGVPGGIAPGTASATGDSPRSRLRLVADHDHFPLRAQWMEREFGLGVQDRSAAAVLYIGGTSYVMPTIALPAV